MQVNIIQKVVIRTLMEAVHVEWECPVCGHENSFDHGEGSLELCFACGFILPEQVWAADETEQEMNIDGQLIDDYKLSLDEEEEKDEDETEEE